MPVAVFVRESLDLSDATEQMLLRFAKKRNLVAGDTLIIAARIITSAPNYVFDLRDSGDPAYLLNLVLIAEIFNTPQLTLDVSGQAATAPGQAGTGARSAEIYARAVAPLSISARGGAGAAGGPGQPGLDEIMTIEIDDRGRPRRDFEPATPGGPGGDAGAGGAGGAAIAFWSEGTAPVTAAGGGAGADGGQGGEGGRGAMVGGRRRPGAPDGPAGRASGPGLAGTAVSQQLPVAEVWAAARGKYADALAACGSHWRRMGEYRFRQVRGRPTEDQADAIVALFDLALLAFPADAEAATLRSRFLEGENAIGLARDLDVIPDFERYARRLQDTGASVERMFNDAKDMLTIAASSGFTQAQLEVHLNALDFTKTILDAERADADNEIAIADIAQKGAAARHEAIVSEVRKTRDLLDQQIDWGGIVVVGMFTIAGFLISAYSSPQAGKIVGSIPELMYLGKLRFTNTEKEASVLKEALVRGSAVAGARKGAREAAEKAKKTDPSKPQSAEISIEDWVQEVGPVIVSFAKFATDITEANGDPASKALLLELAARLQDRLVAEARFEQARRRAAIAQMRIDAVSRERAQYAAVYARAQSDVTVARDAAVMLLGIVQRYGDIFLGYQFQAARAVEIYTLSDQSNLLAMDRWHVSPDDIANFLDDIISPVMFQSRLISSATELSILSLFTVYDTFDFSGFEPDVHFVSITDGGEIDAFKQQGRLAFTVGVDDLAGTRWQAKVMAVTVTLHGAAAATPTFALIVTHTGRCSEKMRDNTIVTQVLRPRSAIVQVAATSGGMAVGAAVGQTTRERPTDFWRRAVAAEWTIAIEPEVIRERQVDLTALTKIDLSLSYIALTNTA